MFSEYRYLNAFKCVNCIQTFHLMTCQEHICNKLEMTSFQNIQKFNLKSQKEIQKDVCMYQNVNETRLCLGFKLGPKKELPLVLYKCSRYITLEKYTHVYFR